MTPRSLFLIILRVLGILSFNYLLTALGPMFTLLRLSGGNEFESTDWVLLFVSLVGVVGCVGICWLLIFRSGWIIDKLGLDKGFSEETLNFKLDSRSILHITLLLTAVFLLVNSIPPFIMSIYDNFNMAKYGYFDRVNPDWSITIQQGVRILIASLLIGERKRILDFLMQEKVKDANASETEK